MEFLLDEFTVMADEDGEKFVSLSLVGPLGNLYALEALLGQIVSITEVEDDNDN